MRTTKFARILLMACLGLFLTTTSCSDDDDFNGNNNGNDNPENTNPNAAYAEGIFVVNEGSQSAGTISFISPDLQSVEQEIFKAENPNAADLGLFLQGMFFDDQGRAYIISNGSNLITVVDRYTFEVLGRIDSGLNVPRHGVVENGKAFVTNQASFSTGDDDYVAVIDLETLEVTQKVEIGKTVEYIKEENGKLYIQNAAYGTGNHITVMSVASNQVLNTITVGNGINDIEIENGTLYVLTKTKLQQVQLGSYAVSTQINFNYTNNSGEPLSPKNMEIENGTVYYTVKDRVYTVGISATAQASQPLFSYGSSSSFGFMYGFAVENNRIFVADGGDFASDSYVKIYDLAGQKLAKINVGVAPNGFYFNDGDSPQ